MTTPSAPDLHTALRALAAEWDADCPGMDGKHRLCKGGQLTALLDAHPDTEPPEASATVDLDPFIDRLAAAQYRDLDSHAASMSWDEYKADDIHGAAVLYRDPMRRYVLHSLPWLPQPAPAPREAVEREALAAVGVVRIDSWKVVCQECREEFESGEGWTIWADHGYAVEQAQESEWLIRPGLIICASCAEKKPYCRDENDECVRRDTTEADDGWLYCPEHISQGMDDPTPVLEEGGNENGSRA